MSFWNSIVDVLRNPAFRIGSGVAGAASGAGAFEGLGDWGQAISGLAGAANIASGSAAAFGPGRSTLDKITGGLQIGLGGYNVGQSLGAVGNFGDVYNSLTGGSGASGGSIGSTPAGTDSYSAGGAGGSFGEGGGQYSLGTAPAVASGRTDLGALATSNPTSALPTTANDQFGGAIPGQSYAQLTPADVPGGGWANPPPPPSMPGGGPQPDVPPNVPAPVAIPPEPMPAIASPPRFVPNTPGLNPPVVTPPVTPAATTADPSMTARIINPGGALASAGATPARGDWLDRAWTSLADAAASNPVGAAMAAVSVGSILTQMFAASKADVAADVLRELKASQPTPGAAPDGTEFRRLFGERATRLINDQYATTLSGLEAKFAARGMLRSTVYTNAVAALDKAKADNIANIETNAYTAWNQALREWSTAAGVTNQTAAQQAANLGAVSSYVNATVPQMDFSNMTRVLAGSPFAQATAANVRQA